ncbi:hypothetical protein E4T56_gene5449 [Termitomyces sp. T112]|nr:hypothetical protein E4T56_gene5449 [Termitomyces sp. T112]
MVPQEDPGWETVASQRSRHTCHITYGLPCSGGQLHRSGLWGAQPCCLSARQFNAYVWRLSQLEQLCQGSSTNSPSRNAYSHSTKSRAYNHKHSQTTNSPCIEHSDNTAQTANSPRIEHIQAQVAPNKH